MSQRRVSWPYRATPRSPDVLVCAGLDPSGGAGLIADTRVISQLGARPCGVVTALTVQNTTGVVGCQALDPELIGHQLAFLMTDIEVRAVKIGMIGSTEIAKAIANALHLTNAPVVWDPVLYPSRGDVALADSLFGDAIDVLRPHLALVTPERAPSSRSSPTRRSYRLRRRGRGRQAARRPGSTPRCWSRAVTYDTRRRDRRAGLAGRHRRRAGRPAHPRRPSRPRHGVRAVGGDRGAARSWPRSARRVPRRQAARRRAHRRARATRPRRRGGGVGDARRRHRRDWVHRCGAGSRAARARPRRRRADPRRRARPREARRRCGGDGGPRDSRAVAGRARWRGRDRPPRRRADRRQALGRPPQASDPRQPRRGDAGDRRGPRRARARRAPWRAGVRVRRRLLPAGRPADGRRRGHREPIRPATRFSPACARPGSARRWRPSRSASASCGFASAACSAEAAVCSRACYRCSAAMRAAGSATAASGCRGSTATTSIGVICAALADARFTGPINAVAPETVRNAQLRQGARARDRAAELAARAEVRAARWRSASSPRSCWRGAASCRAS